LKIKKLSYSFIILKLSCKFLDAGSIFLYNFQNPELYIKKTRPYTTFKKEVVGHSGNIRWNFFFDFLKKKSFLKYVSIKPI